MREPPVSAQRGFCLEWEMVKTRTDGAAAHHRRGAADLVCFPSAAPQTKSEGSEHPEESPRRLPSWLSNALARPTRRTLRPWQGSSGSSKSSPMAALGVRLICWCVSANEQGQGGKSGTIISGRGVRLGEASGLLQPVHCPRQRSTHRAAGCAHRHLSRSVQLCAAWQLGLRSRSPLFACC